MKLEKLQVGMKVKIREDLCMSHCYYGLNEEMEEIVGQEVTIESISDTSFGQVKIRVEENSWDWNPKCFASLEKMIDEDGNLY